MIIPSGQNVEQVTDVQHHFEGVLGRQRVLVVRLPDLDRLVEQFGGDPGRCSGRNRDRTTRSSFVERGGG